MRMNVLMLVSMNNITVAVFVSVNVFVLVRMLQADCVFHHNNSADYHNCQCNVKLN